jgi:hypothetical protein
MQHGEGNSRPIASVRLCRTRTSDAVLRRILEAPPGFEPSTRSFANGDGGFADRAGTAILLIRPAFWSALLPRLSRCLGEIVPKLFPIFIDLGGPLVTAIRTGNHRKSDSDVDDIVAYPKLLGANRWTGNTVEPDAWVRGEMNRCEDN